MTESQKSNHGAWIKEYQGKRYRVRASRQAAEKWFQAKFKSLGQPLPVQAEGVEAQVDAYLNSLTPPKPSPISKLKSDYLHKLVNANLLPQNIDQAAIADHLRWLNQQPWSMNCKRNRLKIFKLFACWQAAQSKVDLAKLLNGLPVTPHNMLLWALLCLNCGLTVAELGRLTWDEIDLAEGMVTRRRKMSRTAVRFRLWPETLQQLHAIPHRTGLVIADGKSHTPMYQVHNDGTKDLLSTRWQRAEPKPEIKLIDLRRIAATCLNNHQKHRGGVDLYLGHALRPAPAKQYVAINQSLFDEAVGYLRLSLLGVQVMIADSEVAILRGREKLLVEWVQEAQEQDHTKAVQVYRRELAEVRSQLVGCGGQN